MDIKINKVTTKMGDQGKTLGPCMQKFEKASAPVEFLGGLDELNCQIGLVLLKTKNNHLKKILNKVQNQIFNIGANFFNQKEENMDYMISFLEKLIEKLNGNLPTLNSFLLPQGNAFITQLHISRAYCRSVERKFWAAVHEAPQEKKLTKIGIYLNRLSDLLFVIIRRREGKMWDPKDI